MPIYLYSALTENGVLATGEGVATSNEALRHELVAKGLLVQDIRQKNAGLGLRRKRIKAEEFLLFNQEFVALIRAGLTIPDALKIAADRPDSPMLASLLRHVDEEVHGGALLSEACSRHPEVFDGLYVSAIKAGEKTGVLAAVLEKYQAYLKRRVGLQKTISHAMTYPVFLLLVLGTVLGVLFLFVMPRFVAMYTDFGAELPLPTQILVTLVNNLPFYLPVVLLLGTLGWFAIQAWVKTEAGRLRADHLKGRLPILGKIYQDIAIVQLVRTLATLLSGGTPLVEAMRITQDALTNRAKARALAQAETLVMGGQSLASAMHSTQLMPGTAIKMVEVGEASGGLDAMLEEIAQFYEEILTNKLTRMTALIEPLLMLIMGVMIGGTIIVMYLPIFQIADIVK
ncbi:MAG: type II secretion system F family protein [Gammaproteobacteria bacterium]|nr:type II secretion system F family protein [Gammaproteobacteria bacterium]